MLALSIILLLVLFLPFTKLVEHNLEIFLFLMGLLSILVTNSLDLPLIKEALFDPISITIAVIVAGLLFRWFKPVIERSVIGICQSMSQRVFVCLFVICLGLIASLITAIVAAVILVSVISILRLEYDSEILLSVLACFAIGLGAVLTPIGEPLSTIVVGGLDESFAYLLELLGIYVIPGVVMVGVIAGITVKPSERMLSKAEYRIRMKQQDTSLANKESYLEIIIRGIKIYIFIMALTFLGAGFQPFIETFLLDLDSFSLYWINMISAVLDNATLAAAEISPEMSHETIKAILLGLLISGGMLIPGNIPNIIAAGKLKITSREYARIAIPIGLIMMSIYFIIILVIG